MMARVIPGKRSHFLFRNVLRQPTFLFATISQAINISGINKALIFTFMLKPNIMAAIIIQVVRCVS